MMRSKYRGKILALDEEELVRNLFHAVLSRFGYNVALAKHGQDAFDLYKSESTTGKAFDLVIIDLSAGRGMGGTEVFDRLRAFDPNIRAVISSGHLPNDAVEVYKGYGFADVLPKPFSLEKMASVLNRVLADRSKSM
jgi:CheY-like chemotaxis protein